jgi:hypothetical protein
MSKKENNLHDILRNKFNEQEIPFEEADWKNMRRTIDAKRAAKKRTALVLIASAALLLCIGTVGLLSISKDSGKPAQITASGTQADVNSNVTAPNSQAIASNNTVTGNKAEGNGTDNNVTQEPVTTKPAINENTVSPTTSNKSDLGSQKSEVTSTTGKSHSKSMANISNYQPVATSKHTSHTHTSATVAANNENSNTEDTRAYPNNAVNTLNTPPVLPDNPVNTLVTPPPVVTPPAPVQNTVPDKKPVVAQTTPVVVADSGKNATPQNTEALPPIPREKSGANKFSVEIGGGYSFGWKYGDTNNGRSFIPTIGLGYTRQLSAKWAIKTGIQANALNGLSNSSYRITHVNYDFGYNCNDTTVTTKWLVYLTIPLQIEYSLNDKNAIGLGGSASYLVTGWGTVNTQSQTSSDNAPPAPGQFNQYLYVKGYNKWDASVYLLYKRQFCTRFSAYVMPYFGMMDIKNNAFFGQNTVERNSGIKLLLSYTIY